MEMKKSSHTPLVYSTEQGRMCPGCGKPSAACVCRQQKSGIPGDGVVRIGRETKGRKGAGVTVIIGLPLDPDGVSALARELKKICGSGGTVKEGRIEIQGDHRQLLLAEMHRRGWKAKQSGG